MANTWRENLKSGALSQVYGFARSLKRRLRNEPVAGTLAVPQVPLAAEALRALAGKAVTSQARIQYSLGLAYLEEQSRLQDRMALACLRAAEAFDFESPERTRLYRALIAARSGDNESALRLAADFSNTELTAEEVAILEGIRGNTIAPLAEDPDGAGNSWKEFGADETRTARTPDSPWREMGAIEVMEASRCILVIDDHEAVSATWAAGTPYLLVSECVTGLNLEAVRRTKLRFGLGVGPAGKIKEAKRLGIACDEWRPIAENGK